MKAVKEHVLFKSYDLAHEKFMYWNNIKIDLLTSWYNLCEQSPQEEVLLTIKHLDNLIQEYNEAMHKIIQQLKY
mgnify:CR=1 FL=1